MKYIPYLSSVALALRFGLCFVSKTKLYMRQNSPPPSFSSSHCQLIEPMASGGGMLVLLALCLGSLSIYYSTPSSLAMMKTLTTFSKIALAFTSYRFHLTIMI